ncbi:hypothetical protein PILCRDRAFT_813449 [Piloderma croceum F 1598]|uniref:Uncharacterized protein n=1 Tax=Piloderma croceum (strain F 1598) TaxID=765440 RepID=A0A0C3GFV4_PILCF|nr:hypothetical protein PILCRDRAFT_813449 [Piloderma croceum F 1598]
MFDHQEMIFTQDNLLAVNTKQLSIEIHFPTHVGLYVCQILEVQPPPCFDTHADVMDTPGGSFIGWFPGGRCLATKENLSPRLPFHWALYRCPLPRSLFRLASAVWNCPEHT